MGYTDMTDLTEKLRAYGADVDEGIRRCASKEELYLKLVRKLPDNTGFSELPEAIEKGDIAGAFEIAHKLKGAVANLSLKPLSDPIEKITESLRAGEDRDYSLDLREVEESLQGLKRVIE